MLCAGYQVTGLKAISRTGSNLSILMSVLRSYSGSFVGFHRGQFLGPTLCILYVNDTCNVSNFVKFILFADDTNVFCAGDNQ